MHNPPASAHLIGLPNVILCQRLGSGAVQTVFGTFEHFFLLSRTNRDSGNLWVVHASGRRSKTWGKTAPRSVNQAGREADGKVRPWLSIEGFLRALRRHWSSATAHLHSDWPVLH